LKSKIKELEKKDETASDNGITGLDDDLFKDDDKPKKAHKKKDHTKKPEIVFHK